MADIETQTTTCPDCGCEWEQEDVDVDSRAYYVWRHERGDRQCLAVQLSRAKAECDRLVEKLKATEKQRDEAVRQLVKRHDKAGPDRYAICPNCEALVVNSDHCHRCGALAKPVCIEVTWARQRDEIKRLRNQLKYDEAVFAGQEAKIRNLRQSIAADNLVLDAANRAWSAQQQDARRLRAHEKAAMRLCKIYRDIAAKCMPEDRIRELRDEAIARLEAQARK